MGTPLGWLERMPTYKDQIEKLKDRDLATYGFLGYPLLQAADILIYKAAFVPVGEDQASHVEITREVARRFNHLYGREPNFDELVEAALKKLGKDARARPSRRRARPISEDGDAKPLARARPLDPGRAAVALPPATASGSTATCAAPARRSWPSRRRCTPRLEAAGLDGAKMSKSYGNAIAMREEPAEVDEEDPPHADRSGARAPQRSGRPREVPGLAVPPGLFERRDQGLGRARLHHGGDRLPRLQAAGDRRDPARAGAVARARRAVPGQPEAVHWIVEVGTERARTVARETMRDVREAMGLSY